MGIIDKVIYTVTCNNCGTTEKSTVLDKGSPYGSAWRIPVEFTNFESVWIGGGEIEPKLEIVKCKKCGSKNIDVESEYQPC